MAVLTRPTTTNLLADLRQRYGLEPAAWPEEQQQPAIPTGIAELDRILGGGIPGGAVTEVSGPAGVGKSTLAMMVAAQAQRVGLAVAVIAGEPVLMPDYLHHLGVDTESLVVLRPDTLEVALEAVRALVVGFRLVIVDSVAAFPSRYEQEGEIGDYIDGKIEQVWDQAHRCIGPALQRSGAALLLVNQIRERRGVLFGNPERQVAEEIIAYWASVRVDLRRVAWVREKGEVIGSRIQARVTKNKMAPPLRVAEFDIIYRGDHAGGVFG